MSKLRGLAAGKFVDVLENEGADVLIRQVLSTAVLTELTTSVQNARIKQLNRAEAGLSNGRQLHDALASLRSMEELIQARASVLRAESARVAFQVNLSDPHN